jgi:general secretion pathway protein K
MRGAQAQRGIALLTAIILVAIATIVAVSVAWQSTLHARRAVAGFSIEKSVAYSHFAEAGAAELLRYSRTQNPTTTAPGQEWAKPQGPMEIEPGVVLEAGLEDQSGKFNLNSLVSQPNPGGPLSININAYNEFQWLLQSLAINTEYAGRLVDWLDTDNQPYQPGGAEDSYYLALDPPYRPLNRTLTSISELLAMGMDLASYDKLKNLVTVLPPNTLLNLCTAPAEVLNTLAGAQTFSADLLAQQRPQFTCFPDKQTFMNSVVLANKPGVQLQVATISSYFRLRTWITIGTTRFTLYSLMEQDPGGQIRTILRTFGTE